MTLATDNPIPIALALLDRQWPVVPALADEFGAEAVTELERDPRYVIGRLQQALTALLATDLPPMDPQTSLLSRPSPTPSPGACTTTGRAQAARTRSATRAAPTGTRPTGTTPWPAPSVPSATSPLTRPGAPTTRAHRRAAKQPTLRDPLFPGILGVRSYWIMPHRPRRCTKSGCTADRSRRRVGTYAAASSSTS
jgi:hypothetical protein